MKGCPWCLEMKNTLKESKIKFIERDIDKYKSEYDLFVEATGNDYVPALMLLTLNEGDAQDVKLMAPDRDYEDISEAVDKVKEYLNLLD